MRAEAPARPSAAPGLPLRQLIPGWTALCLVAVFAWTATLAWGGPMGAGAGTMGLSLSRFLVVWVVMMAAMMLPSVGPTAILWIRSVGARPSRRARVAGVTTFLGGYLIGWAAFGAGVYVILLGTGRLANGEPRVARWVGVAIFLAAGVYQLTTLKAACLHRCRTPLGSLLKYASVRGRWRDLRVGVRHGLYCVGCCWGLMIVVVAVGAMNVPAMVALAGVILVEKLWRYGRAFSLAAGVVLLGLAALAPFIPALLPGLTMSPAPGM